ncbi:MAG: hypothetical protein IJV69_01475, partial [Kiritimatiellae bacterium]|nr:hypothetical protein [Kiritimatiellia bacterium]
MSQNFFSQAFRHIRTNGTLLRRVETRSALGVRKFEIYAYQDDRFIFQISAPIENDSGCSARQPVVLIRRKDLLPGNPKGWVLAIGAGHFGTILTPLFEREFGIDLCKVPPHRRTDVIARKVVLASLTARTLDLLQRDTEFELLAEADLWLQQCHIGLEHIRFFERTPEVLDYTEKLGQHWRVRHPVYALAEMRETLQRARQHLESDAHYYLSVRGIRWLTYDEYQRMTVLAREAPERAIAALREWVAMPSGANQSAMRSVKFAGRHAMEFFGISRDAAEQFLIPSLERILEGIMLKRMMPDDVADTLEGIGLLFKKFLISPELANANSETSIRKLYALISDDMAPLASTIDFDARRIALPGATFNNGIATYHPAIDKQSRTVIDYLIQRLSQNELAEYINIYDVRSAKVLASGSGQSREIVLRTNRTPVPTSYIQKRLGSVRSGYANYLLARANVFRALGVDYPFFQLINVTSHEQHREETPYFIRSRCPGDPLDAIPITLFKVDPNNPESCEDANVILALAELYGCAAAENLAVKKFIAKPDVKPTCRVGHGKEIFEFVYDARYHRPMPARVRVCSIRGTMGWPNLTRNSTNLRDVHKFYLREYAVAMGNFWRQHAETCTLNECASA